MPISVNAKYYWMFTKKYILRLPSSQPLYMRGKVTFRKCNKCQVCLYPSWTSNERPSFASTFSVGHPKAHRRASIQTNYHSSLFLFVRCEKKNRTMWCFSIKIKGNSLLFYLFVRKWELWSCEVADGDFALGVEELWRQRQKCQHIICQNAIHSVEKKGQGVFVFVWQPLNESYHILRPLLSVCGHFLCG